jgi:hypothetical protein
MKNAILLIHSSTVIYIKFRVVVCYIIIEILLPPEMMTVFLIKDKLYKIDFDL